jgi:hypothetical protein
MTMLQREPQRLQHVAASGTHTPDASRSTTYETGHERMADRVHDSPRQLAQRSAIARVLGPGRDATPTVQFWGWRSLFGGKSSTTDDAETWPTDEERRQAASTLEARNQPYNKHDADLPDQVARLEQEDSDAVRTGPLEKTAKLAGKAGSIVGTSGSLLATLGTLADTKAVGFAGSVSKQAGAGLGALGYVANATAGFHDVATSQEQPLDKTMRGIDAAGLSAKAVQAGATGLRALPDVLSSSSHAAGLVAHAVGPAALVAGGADLMSGLMGGFVARGRSKELAQTDRYESLKGIRGYASKVQDLKATSNFAKAASGALSVAGGATLMALGASNPLGWAALAGAGGIAAASGIYSMYRKHQMGNELQPRQGTRGYSDLERDGIVAKDAVPRNGLTDYFKTEPMRRHDDARAQIATKLATLEDDPRHDRLESDPEDYEGFMKTSARTIENLGLKSRNATEKSSLTGAGREQRQKEIAKALDV